ncbi:unnamed protein product [Psylliodes chrysocephalus]|uniref:Regulatory protein zeste n=1 Tax=Psylliodes chrysocephalus TaxID=3402493 RepID=A0A9P0CS74_9CUCU|nr:unnamed protein product [Psylliodes chrysocephala]
MSGAIFKAKKQRGANTAVEQYEEYIKFLENDELFRTGTINPTVPENYIKQKWEELTIKLNYNSKGPQLTTDKWIQHYRFKYRKYPVNKNKTGGGPKVKNPLTSLEEKAINAWGKVVVGGSSLVPELYGDIIQNTPTNAHSFYENILKDFNIENIESMLEDNAQFY